MDRKIDQPEVRFIIKLVFITGLIGLFSIAIPFVLLANYANFSALVDSLRLNGLLVEATSLVNNQNYGSIVLAFFLAIATGYVYVLVDSSSKNYYIVSEPDQEREFGIILTIFRLLNYILPLIIVVYALLSVNHYLSGHLIIQLLLGVVTFFVIFLGSFYRPILEILVSLLSYLPYIGRLIKFIWDMKIPFIFIIGLIILLLPIIPVLLKESVMLFLLFIFGAIVIDIVKDIDAITRSYKSSEFFLIKENKIKLEGKGTQDFWWDFLARSTLVIVYQRGLVMSGLIFLAAAIIMFSNFQGFTVVTPIYTLLGLVIWCTILQMMAMLPKKKARICFVDKQPPMDVIIIEENYKNGYMYVLQEDNKRQKLLLQNISKIEEIND